MQNFVAFVLQFDFAGAVTSAAGKVHSGLTQQGKLELVVSYPAVAPGKVECLTVVDSIASADHLVRLVEADLVIVWPSVVEQEG
jgi:hypothetical protein